MSGCTTWMPSLCTIIVISGVFLALFPLATFARRTCCERSGSSMPSLPTSPIPSRPPFLRPNLLRQLSFFLITRRMVVKLSAQMRACRIYHDIITRTMFRLSFFSSGSGTPGCSACALARSDLLSAPAHPAVCVCLCHRGLVHQTAPLHPTCCVSAVQLFFGVLPGGHSDEVLLIHEA